MQRVSRLGQALTQRPWGMRAQPGQSVAGRAVYQLVPVRLMQRLAQHTAGAVGVADMFYGRPGCTGAVRTRLSSRNAQRQLSGRSDARKSVVVDTPLGSGVGKTGPVSHPMNEVCHL